MLHFASELRGASDELVYSLGEPGQGSIFFDSLIDAVKSREAEATYRASDQDGRVMLLRRGIILLGDLEKQITSDVEEINRSKGKQYSIPWEGSVEPSPVVSMAGFFFLSNKKGLDNYTENITLPSFRAPAASGAVSSVAGQPEVKIFNQPQEYVVRGLDISQYNGEVKWDELFSSGEGGRCLRVLCTFELRRAQRDEITRFKRIGMNSNGFEQTGSEELFTSSIFVLTLNLRWPTSRQQFQSRRMLFR